MKKVSAEYRIRYNTNSKDDTDRWRLIENGNEIVVGHIIVDGHTYTTKNWMPELDDWKWHISCRGHCEIIENVAYIRTIKEDSVILRHILKTISYRFIGTILTIIIAHLVGASLRLSFLLGLGELIIKPLVYFLHERFWYKFLSIKKK